MRQRCDGVISEVVPEALNDPRRRRRRRDTWLCVCCVCVVFITSVLVIIRYGGHLIISGWSGRYNEMGVVRPSGGTSVGWDLRRMVPASSGTSVEWSNRRMVAPSSGPSWYTPNRVDFLFGRFSVCRVGPARYSTPCLTASVPGKKLSVPFWYCGFPSPVL